jgi:hypothetical protein
LLKLDLTLKGLGVITNLTMKAIFAFVVIIIATTACQKPLVGKWADNIHLSGKDFMLAAYGDSVLITAKEKWWAINSITLDGNNINFNPTHKDVCNFNYFDTNLNIKSIDCDTLFVKMNLNKSNAERILQIGFSAGDYFDAVKITQKKK